MVSPDLNSLTGEFMQKFLIANLPARQHNGALAWAIDAGDDGLPVYYEEENQQWKSFFDNTKIEADSQRQPHSGMHVDTETATTITDQTTFFIVTSSTTLAHSHEFDMPQDGRLRYTGTNTRMVMIVASFSFSAAGNSQEIHIGIMKGGVLLAGSERDRTVATAGVIGMGATQAMITLDENEYIEFGVKNSTAAGADDVTFRHLGISVFSLAGDFTGVTVP